MLSDYLIKLFGEDYLTILAEEANLEIDPVEYSFLYIADRRTYLSCFSFKSLAFALKGENILRKISILFQVIKNIFINKSIDLSKQDRVFLETLNGLIVIDFNTNRVKKIITPKVAEPDFILNEKLADQLLRDLVPLVTKAEETYSLLVIESEYLLDHNRLSFDSWSPYKNLILEIVFKFYKESGIEKKISKEIFNLLAEELSELKERNIYKKEIIEIEESFNGIKDILLKENFNFIYNTHVHGDLMPNNILIKEGKLKIFDWANGGFQNIFYDLMIQEFYWPNSNLWKEFAKLSKDELQSNEYFKNFAKEFFSKLENCIDENIGENYIKLNLIICLLEMAIKNAHRHSFNSLNLEEGRNILNIVKRILFNIERSFL